MRKTFMGAVGLMFSIFFGTLFLLNIQLSNAYCSGNVISQSEDLGLVVDAPQSFFNIINFAPGDSVEKTLTVRNSGDYPLKYSADIVNKSADGKITSFLEMLELCVIDQNGKVCYEGSLMDAGEINNAVLSSGDSDCLIWRVSFPKEAGNEYQGVAASFDVIFTASSTGDNEDENNGGGNGGSGGDNDDNNNSGNDPGEYGGSNNPGDGDGDIPGEDILELGKPDIPGNVPGDEPGSIPLLEEPGQSGEAPGEKLDDPVSMPNHKPSGGSRLPFTGGNYLGYLAVGLVLAVGGLILCLRGGRRT